MSKHMKIRKTVLAALLALSIFASGCFSTKKPVGIHVSSVYPFEGRYDSSAEISINGSEAEIREEDSIWILSSMTLFNLLTSVSDSEQKIVFERGAEQKSYILDKKARKCDELDPFDSEEYIWQNWMVPTNGLR